MMDVVSFDWTVWEKTRVLVALMASVPNCTVVHGGLTDRMTGTP